MFDTLTRDLDAFDAELEEVRRQIVARRRAIRDRTGRSVPTSRLRWLRNRVRDLARGRT